VAQSMGQSQWDQSDMQGVPQQGMNAAQVRWHLTPTTGVTSGHTVCNGEEQVLGRFDMVDQKLTVSRAQCLVQVGADGTALIASLGKRPTGLRRRNDAPWYGLAQGYHVLVDGEQVSLDVDSGESFGWQGLPYTAVFTCHKEGGDMGTGYEQGLTQLPYPWIQLVDPEGAVYYANQQTGCATRDPRVPHYPQQ